MRRNRGFTLVELLVALFALALLAMLSWRALDGMTRAQQVTQQRADEVLALQTGLAQWGADLAAVVEFPQLTALDWNGRALRLLRRGSTGAGAGVQVVAWALRDGQWRRWQSLPCSTRGEVEAAWLQADQWSQNPGDLLRQQEVAITPLAEWQIFYFRENAWTNPLSSDAQQVVLGPDGEPVQATSGSTSRVLPDGVRLVLDLPPGQALTGRLTWDWVRPTVGGQRS